MKLKRTKPAPPPHDLADILGIMDATLARHLEDGSVIQAAVGLSDERRQACDAVDVMNSRIHEFPHAPTH